MVKKIGSLLFLLLFVFCSYLIGENSIVIQITDVNGESLSQAAVGVPFVIEVIVSGDEISNETPKIYGLRHLNVQEQGLVSTLNSSINGKRSMRKVFRYIVRPDKTGTVMIGPAIIEIEGNKVKSNTINLKIAEQQKTNSQNVSLQLSCSFENAVVGQAIPLVIRFYPGKSAQLIEMSKLTVSHGSIESINGPFSGTELKDGEEVSYLEWRANWHPSLVGITTIPAIRAIYKDPSKKKSSRFTFDLFNIFDADLEQKTIYSNNLTIKIDSLPQTEHETMAVGDFTSFKAIVEPSHARVGEGMVLKLILTGNGNVSSINAPMLRLPDGITCYESKQYIDDANQKNKPVTKVFEYIVQSQKSGAYQIPPQDFYYYNVNEKEYKKLTSNALAITIENLNEEMPLKNSQNVNQIDSTLLPLLEHNWMTKQERKIPIPIFLLLLLLPLITTGARLVHTARQQYYIKYSQLDKRYALNNARNELKRAYRTNNVQALHALFMNFFAQKEQVSLLTEDNLIQYLKQKQFLPEEIERWHTFYIKCAGAAFSRELKEKDSLFKEAEIWLSLFSDRL